MSDPSQSEQNSEGERPQTIFDVVGVDGITRLVAGFYRRVRTDDVLAPMYPDADFAGAEKRLRDFLIYRFGGPATYIEDRGHPRLRGRHAPFAVDQRARDRWMGLMDAALTEAAFEPAVSDAIHTFLGDVATFLINRPS